MHTAHVYQLHCHLTLTVVFLQLSISSFLQLIHIAVLLLPLLPTKQQSTLDIELLAYCSEANSYTQSHTCMPLTYWIQQQAKFPLLAPVVQDLLSTPSSQAYVESLFCVC